MLFQDMVDFVNTLNQSDGDLSYLELKPYFDEVIDEVNSAIFTEVFDYFPDTFLDDDNYVGLPNRFQRKLICYYVASKALAEMDDFDDQKMEYDKVWQRALADYVTYYFDQVQPIELSQEYGLSIDSTEYWSEDDEDVS